MKKNSNLPLQGKKIIITRAQDKQAEAQKLFSQFGAEVLDMPALVIGPPDDWSTLDKELLELERFDWIIFSSGNGVQAINQRLQKIGKSLAMIHSHLKIGVVGKKTANTLLNFGVKPDFIPRDFIADSLVKEFPMSHDNLRILLPRVQSGGRVFLTHELAKKGYRVTEVAAYESCCPENIPEQTCASLHSKNVDAIAFTSGKTVIHSVDLFKKIFGIKWNLLIKDIKIISIGPQTTLACKKYLERLDEEADPHDLEGLLFATIKALK